MKHSSLILLLLLSVLSNSTFASHILGGEITYEHVENLKYKVYVTIYRDCAECKIANGGGGTSEKECGGFDLFVQQSDRYSCGTAFLEKISLTRTDIRPIIPVCSGVKTKCDSNPNFKYGVEAHVFYAYVDFSKYGTSASCGFDLYIQIFERAGDIDNIEGTPQSFYNYAFINPQKTHNSQKFDENPGMILPANQPFRSIISGVSASSDSIVYSIGEPLSGYIKPLTYASGYSKVKPLSVWCNGSSYCSANPAANPPIGYSLDTKNGALTFTPTATNEKAVLVFEAATYRKNGSTYQLIGLVRRDIQVQTMVVDNHPPIITGGGLRIDICAGEKLNLAVNATDKPFKFPDGTVAAEQTVDFSVASEIDNLTSVQTKITTAPFQKLDLVWQTAESDSRKEPYLISITANDQNCPLNGNHKVLYEIYVHPNPKVKIESRKLWCNNFEKKIVAENNVQLKTTNWKWFEDNQLVTSKYGNVDTFFAQDLNTYYLEIKTTSEFGCETTITDSILPENLVVNALNIGIDGLKEFCVGDKMNLKANLNTNADIGSIFWLEGSQTIRSGNKLDTLIQESSWFKDGIEIWAFGKLGKLNCRSKIVIFPSIHEGPPINVLRAPVLCAKQDVLLDQFCLPTGGIWKTSTSEIVKSNVLLLSTLDTSTPQLICLTYHLEGKDHGCTSVDTSCVRINPLPRLHLKPVTICNFNGTFNLSNLIDQPFGLDGYTVKWIIDGKPDNYQEIDGKQLINLNTFGDGVHLVECHITNEYGCSSMGLTQIELIKDLDITNNGIVNICQGDVRNLSDILDIKPKGGMWQSPSHYDQLKDNHISDQFCGYININYTYDQYGCYATGEYTINVICKPDFEFQIRDTLCTSEIGVQLSATPKGGEFSGPNVINDFFTIGELRRDVAILYQMKIEGCTFNKEHNFFIAASPRIRFSELPPFLCVGKELIIKDLVVEYGKIKFDFAQDSMVFQDGYYAEFKHQLTPYEIANEKLTITTTLSSKFGCPAKQNSIEIPVYKVAKLNLTKSKYEGCSPFIFNPQFVNPDGLGFGRTTVNWNFGDSVSSSGNIYKGLNPFHNYYHPGKYSVQVHTTNAEGCTFDTLIRNAIEVFETPKAEFDILPDRPVSVRLPEVWFVNRTKGAGKLSYHWDFGTNKNRDTSNLISPKFFFIGDTGTYQVTLQAMNDFGCVDHITKTVRVGQDIQLFIPNAFTPNGKGPELTERFKVVGVNVKGFEMEIVNRWGAIVFYSQQIDESWDGRYLGQLCQGGIFAYRIKAVSNTGGEYEFSGTLNMIR